jgi:hypothetical protein
MQIEIQLKTMKKKKLSKEKEKWEKEIMKTNKSVFERGRKKRAKSIKETLKWIAPKDKDNATTDLNKLHDSPNSLFPPNTFFMFWFFYVLLNYLWVWFMKWVNRLNKLLSCLLFRLLALYTLMCLSFWVRYVLRYFFWS